MEQKNMGEVIAALRKQQGMTQQALGQLTADSAVGMLGIGLACLAMQNFVK